MDDPDTRLERAERATAPLPQAPPAQKPRNRSAPYHHELDPDHEDELLLAIGEGLALIERPESDAPDRIVTAIGEYLDAAQARRRRLPSDVSRAVLALGCLYGQQLCRAFGWGWAHLRRAKSPGIVVVSPDRRFAVGPKAVVEQAIHAGESRILATHFEGVRNAGGTSGVDPGTYLRLR
jgi:hypothetical protein